MSFQIVIYEVTTIETVNFFNRIVNRLTAKQKLILVTVVSFLLIGASITVIAMKIKEKRARAYITNRNNSQDHIFY